MPKSESGRDVIARRTSPLKRHRDIIIREGIAGERGSELGEHPLTIWLITSAIIVFLYIRRSQIGIDLHPSEEKRAAKPPPPEPSRVKLMIPEKLPVLPPSDPSIPKRGY